MHDPQSDYGPRCAFVRERPRLFRNEFPTLPGLKASVVGRRKEAVPDVA